MQRGDEKLFAALTIAAGQRLSEFNPQEVANHGNIGGAATKQPSPSDGTCASGELVLTKYIGGRV